MTRWMKLGLVSLIPFAAACGNSDEDPSAGEGTGGSGGSGGSAGTGAAGAGGTAGAAGAGAAACDADTSSDNPLFSQLLDYAREQMAATETSGVAFFVIDGDQTEVAVLGRRSAANCGPVTTQTLFGWEALGEGLTAAAILKAAENGELSLDAPITDYVPYFQVSSGDPSAVTLRHLLLHTSGYPPPPYPGADCTPELADWFRDNTERPLWSAPGQVFAWSNMGIALAGLGLQEATSTPFLEARRQRIGAPLGMSPLDNFAAIEQAQAEHAVGWEQPGVPLTCPTIQPFQYYGHIGDLERFARLLLDGDANVLSSASVELMRTAQGEGFYPFMKSTYGYFGTGTWGGLKHLESCGWGSYGACLLMIPERHFALGIMVNYPTFPALQLGDLAKKIYHGAGFPSYDAARNPTTWGEYAGTYRDSLGFSEDGTAPRTIVVEYANGKLTARLNDQTTNPLEPAGLGPTSDGLPSRDEDVFLLPTPTGESVIRFWRDATGAPAIISAESSQFGPPFFREP